MANKAKELAKELIDMLTDRYKGKEAVDSIATLKADNVDLAKRIEDLSRASKTVLGKPLEKVLRSRGILSKPPRVRTAGLRAVPLEAIPHPGSMPRPDEDAVRDFEASVAPLPGTLDGANSGAEAVSFEASLSTGQNPQLADAFEMLLVGDYIDLQLEESDNSEGYHISASFCGKLLGYVNDKDGSFRLRTLLRHPESWCLLGGRVFAQVVRFRTRKNSVGQRFPYADLQISYAVDYGKANITPDGLLLSQDGRTLVCCAWDSADAVNVPEGVEEVADRAFYMQPVKFVAFPKTLRSIGRFAFYGTFVSKVEIPAATERIGERAFAHYEPEPRGRWNNIDGPVYYVVEEGNARYCASDGSLIEISGEERVLRSFYYRCPPSNAIRLRFSEEVTVLGDYCLLPYSRHRCSSDFWSYRITIPKAVSRIEPRAFSGINMVSEIDDSEVTLTKALADSPVFKESLESVRKNVVEDPDGGLAERARQTSGGWFTPSLNDQSSIQLSLVGPRFRTVFDSDEFIEDSADFVFSIEDCVSELAEANAPDDVAAVLEKAIDCHDLCFEEDLAEAIEGSFEELLRDVREAAGLADFDTLYGKAEYSSDTPWVNAVAFDFNTKRGVYVDASGESDVIRVHRVDGIDQDVRGLAPFEEMDYWLNLDLAWSDINAGKRTNER